MTQHEDERCEFELSETSARTILESVTDSFIALDRDWRFVYVNAAAARSLGRAPSELLGRVHWDEYPGARDTEIEHVYRRVVETQVPETITTYYGEHERWYEIRAFPGAEGGLSVYFRDVTDARQGDAALRLSERRRWLALDSAELGAWHIDPANETLACDDRYRMIVAGSTAPLSFEQAFEAIHPEDQPRVRASVAAAMGPGAPAGYEEEYRVTHPGGTVRWVFAKGRTNLGRAATQHRATSVDGTVADITARKLAEEAVRVGEERYRTLFTAMDEGFCVIDMIRGPTGRWSDYRFLEMNPAFEKHTGLSGVVGRTIREIAPEHEDFWYQTYGRVASSGEPMRFVHHASAIGNRWFDVFAFPLPDASHTRVAVLFKDISDRKQAEEALRIAERRKDEFIATLAHELRNPLAPIRTAIKIIGNEGATASEHATARAIVDRQIATMSRLLDDLLDVSRITAGRLELRRESVSLWAALTAAIEASQPWIDARGHHLALDMPKEPVRLQADPVRLGQIITNLLNNAAKFTAPGGRIDLVAEADEHEVRIEVRDTGIGLAADQTERVFEMFLQVGTDRQVSEPGLGIGLAMVRGLTELHGGRVTARSAGVGCGAVFVVSLPRGSEELPAAPALAGPAPASRRRVLIVDDNADNTLSLAMLLQLDGHEVRTANTAAEALEVVRGFEPDFALLDIGLPDLDGYELAERLRAMPFVHRPTLVAITGRGQSEDKPRAFEAGFTQHFTKPVDPDRISSLLQ